MSMDIAWKPEEAKHATMEEIFLSLGKQAIAMNHYDFAAATRGHELTANDWKEFLSDNRVKAYIDTEFLAIRDAEFRKIISNINSSKSVGQAQIINSLAKMLDANADDSKKGPAFIYMYVPLTASEKQADNTEVLEHDSFRTT